MSDNQNDPAVKALGNLAKAYNDLRKVAKAVVDRSYINTVGKGLVYVKADDFEALREELEKQ